MSGSEAAKVHRTVERVARESYGRLVASLSVHTRDLAGAEDALSAALLKALTAWPRDGVPQNPEGWLLTTARHALIDFFRHQRDPATGADDPMKLGQRGIHLLDIFQNLGRHERVKGVRGEGELRCLAALEVRPGIGHTLGAGRGQQALADVHAGDRARGADRLGYGGRQQARAGADIEHPFPRARDEDLEEVATLRHDLRRHIQGEQTLRLFAIALQCRHGCDLPVFCVHVSTGSVKPNNRITGTFSSIQADGQLFFLIIPF